MNLPDDVAQPLAAEAERRGFTVDEIVTELIVARFPSEDSERPSPRRLSFIGLGASGGGENLSEGHREIIRQYFADKSASEV
jgi:hypothetical protein